MKVTISTGSPFYFALSLRVIASILVILLLGIGLFQNAIPYAEYWLNKDYIASQLCVEKDNPESACKGQCHLMKRLKKNKENQHSPIVLVRCNWEYLDADGLFYEHKTHINQEMIHMGFAYHFALKTALKTSLIKPPEFISFS